MDIAMAASRSLSREISVAAGKPILRGIHHLALVTDNCSPTVALHATAPFLHPSRACARRRDGRVPQQN